MPIAASDVAVAFRALHPPRRRSSGTMTMPPPTPKSALKKPATRPMANRRTAPILRRMETSPAASVDSLSRLAEEPERAAILLDVDGVLAPIVARPEDARVPDETR